MLIIHIIIALSSIIMASIVAIRPQRLSLRISYALSVATIATGSYLLIVHPASLVPACESGLVYLAIAATLTMVARARLRAIAVTLEG